jgi:hypothetical protein
MTWDRRLYFPSERRRAEDFFALKNPTASAGFVPYTVQEINNWQYRNLSPAMILMKSVLENLLIMPLYLIT